MQMNKINSKKGVTEMVLIIGVLVMSATFLALGTARVLVPLIKTEPYFVATDLATTVNAAYAAPENIRVIFKLPEPKTNDFGDVNSMIAFIKIAEKKACVIKLEANAIAILANSLSPISGIINFFAGGNSISFSGDSVTININGVEYKGYCAVFLIDNAAATKEFSFKEEAAISKTYDVNGRKNILEK